MKTELDKLYIKCTVEDAKFLNKLTLHFKTLIKTTLIDAGPLVKKPEDAITFCVGGWDCYLVCNRVVDSKLNSAWRETKRKKLQLLITKKEKKCEDKLFLERAPKDIIDRELETLKTLKHQLLNI